MIAVDTNVLVPLVRTEYPHHQAASARVRALAEGSAAWAIPWPCVHEFLAVHGPEVAGGRNARPVPGSPGGLWRDDPRREQDHQFAGLRRRRGLEEF